METPGTASHSGKDRPVDTRSDSSSPSETNLWTSLSTESRTNLDQFQKEWLQRLGAVEARVACMEALAGNVAAEVEAAALEVEAAALARLKQSFGETIRQACEGLKRYAVACKESRLIELEAEIERKTEPLLSRSQVTISDLERLMESIIRQQQNFHAHTSQASVHDYSQV